MMPIIMPIVKITPLSIAAPPYQTSHLPSGFGFS